MNLKEVQRNWNAFGKIDPLWAILTWPEKRGNQWQLDEFFKTGQEEVDSVMRHTQSVGSNFRNGTALDFGCGVGRLTPGTRGEIRRSARCRHCPLYARPH